MMKTAWNRKIESRIRVYQELWMYGWWKNNTRDEDYDEMKNGMARVPWWFFQNLQVNSKLENTNDDEFDDVTTRVVHAMMISWHTYLIWMKIESIRTYGLNQDIAVQWSSMMKTVQQLSSSTHQGELQNETWLVSFLMMMRHRCQYVGLCISWARACLVAQQTTYSTHWWYTCISVCIIGEIRIGVSSWFLYMFDVIYRHWRNKQN